MNRYDIDRTVDSFARAARLAMAAGFDGVEIHGANGYLIDQFLTEYTNVREDEYGGNVRARVSFACAVVQAVRREVNASAIVGIRLSQTKVNDFTYRWPGGEADAEVIFASLRNAGVSYIHIAGEGRAWCDSAQLIGSSRTLTQVARVVAKVPVIANGGLHNPELADSLVQSGHADFISVARAAIANPDWPQRLRMGKGFRSFDPEMIHPCASIENTDRWRCKHEHPA